MQVEWKTALQDSISKAFGTMFFMVPVPMNPPLERLEKEGVAGWLECGVEVAAGKSRVRVLLWAPGALADQMAANMLALEPGQASGEDVRDAFGELMNMVTGSLLTKVDPEGRFSLGIPETRTLDAAATDRVLAAVDNAICFDVDQSPLLAAWQVE